MSPEEAVQILQVILFSLIPAGATLWILIRLGIESPRWRCQACGRTHLLPVRSALSSCCMESFLEALPEQDITADSIDDVAVVVLA